MLINERPECKRVVNLIRAVRQLGAILPGDKIKMINERPATYVGVIEEGDMQTDYIQMHVFTLHDGVRVVLEMPSLNRSIGKLIY
jgi:hypothetical protein